VTTHRSRLAAARPLLVQGPAGFTLVEVMVSAVIMAVTMAAVVPLSNMALSNGRSATAGTDVRNLIQRDLQWIAGYAKAWKCLAGCSADTANALLDYEQVACAGLADDFLMDANGPNPPFAIVEGVQTLQLVNGAPLNRTIDVSESGTSLLITYAYGGQPPIDRFSSVRIQAAGWCTS
jgi:prepilin-type N-terminal cleavage/methylation domain-containing protein